MKQFKRMSISNLAFYILNPNIETKIKFEAEKELRKRLRCVDFDTVLGHEKSIMDVRGYDIKSYLISDNPNMQLFMELFFKYVHNKDFCNQLLLYSETHICNDVSVLNNSTRNIILAELKNLRKGLREEFGGQVALSEIKNAFTNRLGTDIVIRKEKRFEIFLEENTSLELFEAFGYNSMQKLFPPTFINDFEQYKEKHPIKTKYYFAIAILANMLEDTILASDLAQNLMVLKEVRKDSNMVNRQKKVLLKQARSGYGVDYSFLNKK